MTRLLIVACSDTKRHDAARLPAIERYDGPAFRLLRRARRAGHLVDAYVLILSAEHGLIAEDRSIADYDRRMTADRVRELVPGVSQELVRFFLAHIDCRDVFVNVGHSYQAALGGFAAWCARHDVRLTEAAGGIGERLSQMKRWLERV